MCAECAHPSAFTHYMCSALHLVVYVYLRLMMQTMQSCSLLKPAIRSVNVDGQCKDASECLQIDGSATAAMGRVWPRLSTLELVSCQLVAGCLEELMACTALTRLGLPWSGRCNSIEQREIDPASLPLLPRLRHLDLMSAGGLTLEALVACFDRQPVLRHAAIPASSDVPHDEFMALYPKLQLRTEKTIVSQHCPRFYNDWD